MQHHAMRKALQLGPINRDNPDLGVHDPYEVTMDGLWEEAKENDTFEAEIFGITEGRSSPLKENPPCRMFNNGEAMP